MKNFALINENNTVTNISIASEDWDSSGWIEYTNDNAAFIGGDYFEGYFYNVKPYPSWTRLDGSWIPPVPFPENLTNYVWNENHKEWEEVV